MKKILIVDDDEDLLTNMKSFFKRNGYHVVVTKSCDEGLDIFYSFQPDLVLLDINVSDQDGREMCKKIKSHAKFQHIPVILISANHDALKFHAECGANDVAEKPFEAWHLLHLIRTYI